MSLFEYYLYIISSFWSLFILHLEGQKMELILSSSKWILRLLSTNQSHMFPKSLFNCFLISLIFLLWKTSHVPSAYKNRLHLTAIGISLSYIKNNKERRKTLVAHRMICLKLWKRNSWNLPYNYNLIDKIWNQLTVWSGKPIILNFFKSISWLTVSNAFWRSIKIIPVTATSSKPFKILAFKKERHISIEWRFLKRIDSHIRPY